VRGLTRATIAASGETAPSLYNRKQWLRTETYSRA
jgi:hypothetical protein